jgi:hypothetical protein
MTPYILIIFVAFGHGGGPATAEFSSLEACGNAMSVVEAKFDDPTLVVATVCVPKELEE